MVKKIVLRLAIAIVFTILIGVISNSLMPILGNDVAISQLQYDDAYFIAMNTWHSLQNWLSLGAAIVWFATAWLIVKDVYKAIKIHNLIKNTKENT